MTDPLADLRYPGEPTSANELTLLPVSPRRLLVTWPVLNGSRPSRPGGQGSGHETTPARWCLRIREVRDSELTGEEPGEQWVFELAEGQTGCLVELDRPGLSVRGELVHPSGTNGAVPLARSRRVRLPLPEPVRTGDPIRWMIINPRGRP